jgi:hypothetical protein
MMTFIAKLAIDAFAYIRIDLVAFLSTVSDAVGSFFPVLGIAFGISAGSILLFRALQFMVSVFYTITTTTLRSIVYVIGKVIGAFSILSSTTSVVEDVMILCSFSAIASSALLLEPQVDPELAASFYVVTLQATFCAIHTLHRTFDVIGTTATALVGTLKALMVSSSSSCCSRSSSRSRFWRLCFCGAVGLRCLHTQS